VDLMAIYKNASTCRCFTRKIIITLEAVMQMEPAFNYKHITCPNKAFKQRDTSLQRSSSDFLIRHQTVEHLV